MLDAVEKAGRQAPSPRRFPYTWLRWCQAQQADLLERFLALFDEQLQEPSRLELRAFLLTPADAGEMAPSTRPLPGA